MKVTIKLDVSDETLRRIRKAMGRGGRATRMETRMWLAHTFDRAAEELPDVKAKRPVAVAPEPEKYPSRLEAARLAPLHAVCKHCHRTKDRFHGLMGFTCMPVSGRALGSVFEQEGGAQ